jgi:hypothetical protein
MTSSRAAGEIERMSRAAILKKRVKISAHSPNRRLEESQKLRTAAEALCSDQPLLTDLMQLLNGLIEIASSLLDVLPGLEKLAGAPVMHAFIK